MSEILIDSMTSMAWSVVYTTDDGRGDPSAGQVRYSLLERVIEVLKQDDENTLSDVWTPEDSFPAGGVFAVPETPAIDDQKARQIADALQTMIGGS